jgi:hypothetical protein
MLSGSAAVLRTSRPRLRCLIYTCHADRSNANSRSTVVDDGRVGLAQISFGHCVGVGCIVCDSYQLQPAWLLLECHQPRHAGESDRIIEVMLLTLCYLNQALFSAGLLLLAEKVFLRYVAINYHETALAERLAENRLGLKALDRLSNAHPVVTKKPPYAAGTARGHKTNRSSIGLGFLGGAGGARNVVPSGSTSESNSPIDDKAGSRAASPPKHSGQKKEKAGRRQQRHENKERRKKALAAIGNADVSMVTSNH